MTARMVAAIEHPWIDAIGHPTGRKIAQRAPYRVDVDALVEAAARTGTMIEINGAPDRRDLNDVHARAAAEAGVTDPHRLRRPRRRARCEHVQWARGDRAARVARAASRSPTRGRGRSSRGCASGRARRRAEARGPPRAGDLPVGLARWLAICVQQRQPGASRCGDTWEVLGDGGPARVAPRPTRAAAAAARSATTASTAARRVRRRALRAPRPRSRARGASSASADRAGEVVADQPRVEGPGERQRRVRPRRRRRDEQRSRPPAPRAARARSPPAAAPSRTPARGGAGPGTRRAPAAPRPGRRRPSTRASVPATTSSSPGRRAADQAESTRSSPFFQGSAA